MDENSSSNEGGNSQDNNPSASKPFSIQRPALVSILYLLNFVLGFTVIVGVVLAYIWRGEAETTEWEKTHYTYMIRTFWIGLAVLMAFFVLWMGSVFFTVIAAETVSNNAAPPIGFFAGIFGGMGIFMLSAIWFLVRCIMSLVKAGDQKPMPKPETWLF